jgi:GPH family glycoside/pentoside/hexuronide:cation symporter
MISNCSGQGKLGLFNQIAYGLGDFGPSLAGNAVLVFFLFFMTTVAGLPADLAGLIMFVAHSWSAVSTLIVGQFSDRLQTRWGRRHIWMILSAPIMAVSFILMWWVPPTSEWFRFVYYLALVLIFETAANIYLIPYGALLTDQSDDPQYHVRLNGLRFGFSLAGCMGALVIMRAIAQWEYRPTQQLWDLGLVGAFLTVASIAFCCWGTQERECTQPTNDSSRWQELKSLFQNRPLLFLVGIHALAWLAVQITPAIVPYFVNHYMDLDSTETTQVILVIQGMALMGMFIWEPLSRRLGKRVVHWLGSSIWIVASLNWLWLEPGQINQMYLLAATAGLGMSSSYLVPPSMLPEVADWDELHTGKRREGLFWSLLLFLQKFILATGLFLVGQLLNRFGFAESVPGPVEVIQPESALMAIRYLVVFVPVLALVGSLILTLIYPLDRTTYQNTLFELEKRRLANSSASAN